MVSAARNLSLAHHLDGVLEEQIVRLIGNARMEGAFSYQENDIALLKSVHHLLFEIHVIEGALVCPESGRRFPIKEGIIDYGSVNICYILCHRHPKHAAA